MPKSKFGAVFDALTILRAEAIRTGGFDEVAITCGWSMIRIQREFIDKQEADLVRYRDARKSFEARG